MTITREDGSPVRRSTNPDIDGDADEEEEKEEDDEAMTSDSGEWVHDTGPGARSTRDVYAATLDTLDPDMLQR